jgi:hypothetical protein
MVGRKEWMPVVAKFDILCQGLSISSTWRHGNIAYMHLVVEPIAGVANKELTLENIRS